MRFYVGRFRVPRWLYEACPEWLHQWADHLGGVTRTGGNTPGP